MNNLIEDRLNEVDMKLRLTAANLTKTHYSPCLAEMDQEAQDCYQHAAMKIVERCQSTDTPSFLVNQGKWRMQNRMQREYTYSAFVLSESDTYICGGSECEQENENKTILELVIDSTIDPESALILREEMTNLEIILDQLDPRLYEITQLLRDGFCLPEISEKLGISYDAAWKRLKKIRSIITGAGIGRSFAY